MPLAELQSKFGLSWTRLDFRYTFGTTLTRNGVSLFKISKLMGNSPGICQTHYSNVMPEELTEEVEFPEPPKKNPQQEGQSPARDQ